MVHFNPKLVKDYEILGKNKLFLLRLDSRTFGLEVNTNKKLLLMVFRWGL